MLATNQRPPAGEVWRTRGCSKGPGGGCGTLLDHIFSRRRGRGVLGEGQPSPKRVTIGRCFRPTKAWPSGPKEGCYNPLSIPTTASGAKGPLWSPAGRVWETHWGCPKACAWMPAATNKKRPRRITIGYRRPPEQQGYSNRQTRADLR